ncbi:MAG: M50 family metallopeptidase [Syntrophomonadaceae bacterium]|jgi:stage IV sporulation protein FB
MHLGNLVGIRITVNPLFIFICVIYVYLGLALEIIVVLTSVLAHEIAHSVMARIMGLKIAEIHILPFGGQAKIEDFTGLNPDKEIYVALAGPCLSLSVAAAFYFLPLQFSTTIIDIAVKVNLLLGILNLLPALPLDGGRVLRAVLSSYRGYNKATRDAALIGKIIAILMIFGGCYLTWRNSIGVNFIILGVFLFWAAQREAGLLAYAFLRYLIRKKGELAGKGFLSSKQVVSTENTLIKKILESSQPGYYLVVLIVDDEHHMMGIRTEAELIACLLEKGPHASLRDC